MLAWKRLCLLGALFIRITVGKEPDREESCVVRVNRDVGHLAEFIGFYLDQKLDSQGYSDESEVKCCKSKIVQPNLDYKPQKNVATTIQGGHLIHVGGATSRLSNLRSQAGGATSRVSNVKPQVGGATSRVSNIRPQVGWATSCVSNIRQVGGATSRLSNLRSQAGGATSRVSNVKPLVGGATSRVSNIRPQVGWATSCVSNIRQVGGATSRVSNVKKVDRVTSTASNAKPQVGVATVLQNRVVQLMDSQLENPVSAAHTNGRIFGGQNALIQNHPHLLQLGLNGIQHCAASIISSLWTLTTANCIFGPNGRYPDNNLTLRAGATLKNIGGQLYRVSASVVHELFKPSDSHDYDIAAVKVRNAFQFSTTVKPIALPSQSLIVPDEATVVISGWGETSEKPDVIDIVLRVLQTVKMKMANQVQCTVDFKPLFIPGRMICIGDGKKSLCSGDQGDSVVWDRKLIGMSSWGNSPSCSPTGKPGIFTKVSNFRSWVKDKTDV